MPEVRFGPYTLIKRIAVGGMAEVFLARAQPGSWDDYVVVKQILPQLAEEPDLLQLFFDEARIASRIYHPGIVRIIDVGQHDGIHFLAMEYVDGLDLSQLVRRSPRERIGQQPEGSLERDETIPVGCAIRIAIDLCRALHFAHEAKDTDGAPLEIVHRDVSPHNVLVSKRGEVKLGDFGIARARIRARKTATGVLRGKVAYVSPEQYLGHRGDRRVDIYAVGVVLFEMIASQRPFGGDEAAIIREVMSGSAPSLSSVKPNIDPRLSEIVARTLARTPEERFQTADALADALQDLGLASGRSELARIVLEALRRRGASKGSESADARRHVTTTLPGPDDVAATETFALAPDPGDRRRLDAKVVPISAPSWTLGADPLVETISAGRRASDRGARDSPRADEGEREGPASPDDEPLATARVPIEAILSSHRGWLPPLANGKRGSPPSPIVIVFGLGVVLTVLFGLLGGWVLARWYASSSAREAAGEPAIIGEPADSNPSARSVKAPSRDAGLDADLQEPSRAERAESTSDVRVSRDSAATSEVVRAQRSAKKGKKKIRRGGDALHEGAFPPFEAGALEGELSLDTDPWSYVRVGRRDLGVTPLANVRLPAGRHRVRLENPEVGISRTIVLEIKPEEDLAVRVRLQDGRILRR